MTPEEQGEMMFVIALRNSGFEQVKSPEEMTEKLTAALKAGITHATRAAVEAEHARITEMAEQIERGTITTTKSVAQVLRAEAQQKLSES